MPHSKIEAEVNIALERDIMNQLALDLQPVQSYRLIPLTQGQFALVDAEDFDWLSQWKWCAQWIPDTKSFRAQRGFRTNGKNRVVYMSRLIMGEPAGFLVDHKDGNTLNNRRYNLRLATNLQNSWNAKRYSNNTSGFKGVHWRKDIKRWWGYINVDKRMVSLGYFETAELAHAAYLSKARELRGDFVRIA